MLRKELEKTWNALRSSNAERKSDLLEVRIRNLRGIQDLRIPFNSPVSVLAGPNGCGKSTILFACACAYKVPGRGPRDFVPTSLFPNFVNRDSRLADLPGRTELEFHYLHKGERTSMAWKRNKSWNRSYMGRPKGAQPERDLYLRTLANLTNPSEARGLLQLARKDYQTAKLTPDLLVFAGRILRQRYDGMSIFTANDRDLLFAEIGNGQNTGYSEFHMSSGERAILRMSKDISRLEDALILIDEVEAGLHPYTQQQLMLELQRIALRRRLQIIVASHSPVVLDSVPPEGRIFLDRDETTAEVSLVPAYRDIFQKALYGQSQDRLSLLCEDGIAEGLIRGVLDVLCPKMNLRHRDVIIGRDTGKDEFRTHLRALAKFNKLDDFVFVLDGDADEVAAKLRADAQERGQHVDPLLLPGKGSPERWIWDSLRRRTESYAEPLGVTSSHLAMLLKQIDQMMEGTVQQGAADKAPLDLLADATAREPVAIARLCGRLETGAEDGEMAGFATTLEQQIQLWRQL